MDYLEVTDSQNRRRRVELDRPRLLIGREPTCDICLPHPGVSRRHAQLQATEQGRWLLQDLSSRNHVYVDGKTVQQLVLEPHKPFRIADYALTLEQAATIPEPDQPGPLPDTAEAGSFPDPGWLEQLHLYQRNLLRLAEPREVLERMAHEFQRLLVPHVLAIGLFQPEGYTWELVLSKQPDDTSAFDLEEADRRISEDSASSVQSWVPNGENADGSLPTPSAVNLLLPMKGRTGIVGHVFVQGPHINPVPKPMLRYCSVMAALAGLMWDNLHLAKLRLEQLELEKELQHARLIQTGLFPETFEIDPRLDIFAVNLPSAHVSGDYYDLIRTGPDSIAFVIADAMGHGLPAALLMAAVRSALHMGLSLGLPWPLVFKGLDDVTTRSRGDIFVTGLVGHLDLKTMQLQLVCAGHPLPSILVDGKLAEIPERCRTRPWGLDLATAWDVGQIDLRGKDWSILCYTDGITDAAARVQRTFGAQRVSRFHESRQDRSAEDLCQLLLSEVAVQPGQRSLEDDQTVLVLRSVGP